MSLLVLFLLSLVLSVYAAPAAQPDDDAFGEKWEIGLGVALASVIAGLVTAICLVKRRRRAVSATYQGPDMKECNPNHLDSHKRRSSSTSTLSDLGPVIREPSPAYSRLNYDIVRPTPYGRGWPSTGSHRPQSMPRT
ncbi:hypothetical protein PUNSTDRAFT_144580 [Punctularia strigosozonata HHB-11173 SS5]|uniref:uncharacterized protein n=1 Tax=Punctularia strigosozonata (strain HHB-11173) TaxID=741275 RepID=UPI0004417249|nr:uncharacterized protein PUNSTDRAFT_144580 [Punctularia strigosozonata HHB-11173 SS5]EIN06992.1 hypothetical protein PUNSTDRAFT_144580 [Punctularia strigosozonata HHB-11173 SS5]